MFEVGSSLRSAREHQKLELSQVERATRIRAKYLQALEEERFDALPGTAYVKGFLRTYADFLGLEAQRFVDEYNSRFAPDEIPEAALPVRVRRPRRLLGARLVVFPLLLGIALLVWRLTSSGGNHHAAFSPPPPQIPVSTASPPPASPKPRRPSPARLAIVATRGPCWLSVRLGSQTGKVLYERTLEQGQSARFVAARLWIRIGAPWNVDATLNGKPASLPSSTANLLLSHSALRPAG